MHEDCVRIAGSIYQRKGFFSSTSRLFRFLISLLFTSRGRCTCPNRYTKKKFKTIFSSAVIIIYYSISYTGGRAFHASLNVLQALYQNYYRDRTRKPHILHCSCTQKQFYYCDFDHARELQSYLTPRVLRCRTK